jgi:hypothetical protein
MSLILLSYIFNRNRSFEKMTRILLYKQHQSFDTNKATILIAAVHGGSERFSEQVTKVEQELIRIPFKIRSLIEHM